MKDERPTLTRALADCPQWPVLFSFTEESVGDLERLRQLNSRPAAPAPMFSRKVVVSAVILELAEDPEIIARYSGHSARAVAEVIEPRFVQRLQVRLPSPVTKRLDRLIELASERVKVPCSRSAVVASGMHFAKAGNEDQWRTRFQNVLAEPARVALPDQDEDNPGVILSVKRPSRGPRKVGA